MGKRCETGTGMVALLVIIAIAAPGRPLTASKTPTRGPATSVRGRPVSARSALHARLSRVCVRAPADGAWGEPISLGDAINTPATEFCPMATLDGRYLFFSRRFGGSSWETTTDADVYWVDIAVVERLKR